ncbi:hypothetical protein GCM10017779_23620 [Streptomyces capillispiralis]|nr:hypothetical protein GCM10017779_23620 [Streptomyces capillispiralis]
MRTAVAPDQRAVLPGPVRAPGPRRIRMECVQPRPGPELMIALNAATHRTLEGVRERVQRVFRRGQRW